MIYKKLTEATCVSTAGVIAATLLGPAFWPHHRFVAPFFGVEAFYAAGYSTCWTWVSTVYGWQRAWACYSDCDCGCY